MFLKTALSTLALLCSTGSVTGQIQQSYCSPGAPDNCNFVNLTLCGWTKNSGLTFRGGTNNDFNVALNDNASNGRLTSRTACSTDGDTHCLLFDYTFDRPSVYYVGLSVLIRHSDQQESLLWRLTSGDTGVNGAQVPIQSDTAFDLVFKYERYDTKRYAESTVYVDAISYAKASCAVRPPQAKPQTTTTTATTETMSKLTIQMTTRATETTPPPTPTSSTSNTTGSISGATIAGAVIASLFVVSALIVGIVLLRRKRLLCFKRDALTAKRPLCLNTPNTASPSTTDAPNTPTYLEILPPLDHTYINQPSAAAHPSTANLRQDSQGYEVPPPKTEEDHYEDVDSAERKGHDAPMTRANYDSLDFSDADRDKRVYTSLKRDSEYAEIR
ncbi:uncharacterized protein [Littorina saxatilis]|uniref:uncharacterized protein n=1 Tax=Littorina saxatilis TaxID=31220 RepID=UPI0038B5223A